MRTLISIFALLVLSAATVMAANPETFTVRMTIRQVITITNTADLDFGTVEATAGAYTVNPSAGPHTAGTGAAAATFTIQGEGGATADVSFTTNPVSITNGTDNISVTMTLASATHTFSGAAETLYVGGGLNVLGTESTGTYTATSGLQMVYQ